MKQLINKLWDWVTKHRTLISGVVFPLLVAFFTFVKPFLLETVCIRIIFLIPIGMAPVLLINWLRFNHLKQNRKFKQGDAVILKTGGQIMHILSYEWFSNQLVVCKFKDGREITYHQNSLTFYQ